MGQRQHTERQPHRPGGRPAGRPPLQAQSGTTSGRNAPAAAGPASMSRSASGSHCCSAAAAPPPGLSPTLPRRATGAGPSSAAAGSPGASRRLQRALHIETSVPDDQYVVCKPLSLDGMFARALELCYNSAICEPPNLPKFVVENVSQLGFRGYFHEHCVTIRQLVNLRSRPSLLWSLCRKVISS